jgi:choline/glycine/proline betaine transport protein
MTSEEENVSKSLVAQSGILAGSNPFMAIASFVMILAFVGFTISDVEYAGKVFTCMKGFVLGTMGWFYIALLGSLFFLMIWIMCSRFGNVKLGKDDDVPEFSTFSWICMLFSAGLGSGLIYWGVAEPIYHIQDSPFLGMEGVEPKSMDAALVAMRVTNLHWGFHGWALYALIGMSLAYFGFRKGLPLILRSAVYPILGDKIYGPWGNAVDLIGVFGTVFGLATSLGMGVVPIAAGMEKVFGFANNLTNQLILIAIITCIGTASVASGVGKGVRILSEMNVWLSLLLLVLMLSLGATSLIVGLTISSAGDYIWNFIPMGFWIDTKPDREWQNWWTLFYWAWWIAWGPFVGMFIARISKGRTIREFCICMMFIPVTVVILWMGVFGDAAYGVQFLGGGGVFESVNGNYAEGVFTVINGLSVEALHFPITCLTVFFLISWFVTSSDSGTLVMCTMLSMGAEHPPIKLRIFWGLTV